MAKATDGPPRTGAERVRAARISGINEQLRDMGVIPLSALGDLSKGEQEVLKITDYQVNEFFYYIVFSVKWPNGDVQPYRVFCNTRRATIQKPNQPNEQVEVGGVVSVVTIDNRWMVFTREFRTPLGRWQIEIPRSFLKAGNLMPIGRRNFDRLQIDHTASSGDLKKVTRFVDCVIGRKLHPLLSSELVCGGTVKALGVSAQDPGKDMTELLVLHVDLKSTSPGRLHLERPGNFKLPGTSSIGARFWPMEGPDSILRTFAKQGVTDFLSLGAMMRYVAEVRGFI